ncbi:hypothetical protein D5085_11015 [Ectothiorhodospiraceae bacterium BW-2]|nr:hypothetical protein D5085_11015 [Ectothiorhodospiraceae bacterium BW-2]
MELPLNCWITFTLSGNCTFDGSYYLAFNNANNVISYKNAKQPFDVLSSTSTSITFRVADDTAENAVPASALAAGNVYYLTSGTADMDGNDDNAVDTGAPTIKLTGLTDGSSCNLAVGAKTSTNLVLDSNTGDVKSVKVAEAKNQITATVNTATDFDGVIDVQATPGSSKFTGAATTDTAVIKIISDAGSVITDALDMEFTNGSTDYKLKVTVKGDMTNITSISDGTNTYTIDAANNMAYIEYTESQLHTLNNATFGDTDNEQLDITLTATVNGTAALETRNFTASVNVIVGTASFNNATDVAAGSWSKNGSTAYIPSWLTNASTDTTNYQTYLRITNPTSTAGKVYIKGTADDGTATAQCDVSTLAGVTGFTSGMLGAGASTNMITAEALNTCLSYTGASNKRLRLDIQAEFGTGNYNGNVLPIVSVTSGGALTGTLTIPATEFDNNDNDGSTVGIADTALTNSLAVPAGTSSTTYTTGKEGVIARVFVRSQDGKNFAPVY